MVTEPGTARLPIHQSVAEAATLRSRADSEGSGALASPITADSEGRSRENEAKKARSEPKASVEKSASKSPWAAVLPPQQMFRGAGSTIIKVSPPMLTPKSYEVSSSRAAGAKAENYDEVFGPADAAASELNPGPLTLPSLPPLPCLAANVTSRDGDVCSPGGRSSGTSTRDHTGIGHRPRDKPDPSSSSSPDVTGLAGEH